MRGFLHPLAGQASRQQLTGTRELLFGVANSVPQDTKEAHPDIRTDNVYTLLSSPPLLMVPCALAHERHAEVRRERLLHVDQEKAASEFMRAELVQKLSPICRKLAISSAMENPANISTKRRRCDISTDNCHEDFRMGDLR